MQTNSFFGYSISYRQVVVNVFLRSIYDSDITTIIISQNRAKNNTVEEDEHD